MKQTTKIIQGDTKQLNFNIFRNCEAVDPDIISKVYFTSKELGIQKEAEYTDGKYKVVLSSNETNGFKPSKPNEYYSFDLTVKFVDTTIQTCVYNGYIQVLEKVNGVNYVR